GGRRILWRVDVSSCPRRLQNRAGWTGRTLARAQVYLARYTMDHSASRAVRRDRNAAQSIFEDAPARGGVDEEILGLVGALYESRPAVTDRRYRVSEFGVG